MRTLCTLFWLLAKLVVVVTSADIINVRDKLFYVNPESDDACSVKADVQTNVETGVDCDGIYDFDGKVSSLYNVSSFDVTAVYQLSDNYECLSKINLTWRLDCSDVHADVPDEQLVHGDVAKCNNYFAGLSRQIRLRLQLLSVTNSGMRYCIDFISTAATNEDVNSLYFNYNCLSPRKGGFFFVLKMITPPSTENRNAQFIEISNSLKQCSTSMPSPFIKEFSPVTLLPRPSFDKSFSIVVVVAIASCLVTTTLAAFVIWRYIQQRAVLMPNEDDSQHWLATSQGIDCQQSTCDNRHRGYIPPAMEDTQQLSEN